MAFSSHIFLFYFLPVSLLLYYMAKGPWRLVVLTVLSYGFYGWANPWFVLLLAWATLVDFCCGNLIYGYWQPFGRRPDLDGKPNPPDLQRKLFLTLSLCSNLGLLFGFKYLGFLQENLNALVSAFGLQPTRVVQVILPIGISFYTFESMSYVVDIYRGKARPASVLARETAIAAGVRLPPGKSNLDVELRALLNFACYLAQFPHLVMGPIIRFQDLEKQMYARRHTVEKFSRGIIFVCLGFAKKILIADTMGEVADFAFNGHPTVWTDAWFGLFGYAFQIYFDFSGYSDMAIGLGLMFGFEFAKNFDSPYQATSITDFWRRWHISLSSWLRDYLYFPLGGNQRGRLRTYFNLLIVMLLGGLWHGASWTFVVWGGIHGSWLAIERMAGKQSFYARAPHAVRVAMTFLIVCIAWVFFRAADFSQAKDYLTLMFRFDTTVTPITKLTHVQLWTYPHVIGLVGAAVISFVGVQTWDLARRVTPARAVFSLVVFWSAILVLSVRSYLPFIYERF